MGDESRFIFISKDQKNIKEYKISRSRFLTYLFSFLLILSVAGKFGFDLLIDFSHNSKIQRLERTNSVLQTRLAEMKNQIKTINGNMNQIVKKDDELRLALGLNSISSEVREVGIGGAKYDFTETDEISGFDEGRQLGRQLTELSRLEREVNLEFDSYHKLMTTFQKKQDSLAYLPALRPVIKGLISSPFGNRLHPIYKVRKHHDGLDISAPRGTPIYASANGTIKMARTVSGYGKMVTVDHKYGFQTRYGHMNKILVRVGQIVKRGDKIGEVGSTGISTAPHLHYEVRFKGKAINPAPFFFDDPDLNKQIVINSK